MQFHNDLWNCNIGGFTMNKKDSIDEAIRLCAIRDQILSTAVSINRDKKADEWKKLNWFEKLLYKIFK